MSDSLETTLGLMLVRLRIEITVRMDRSHVEGATNIDRTFGSSEIMNENSDFEYSKEC